MKINYNITNWQVKHLGIGVVIDEHSLIRS